jgi:lipid-A-disaccharide synthase
VRTIGASVDLCCACFLSSRSFIASTAVRAAFVGHPLADQFRSSRSRRARAPARHRSRARVLAVLPGSRRGEVERLAGRIRRAAELLATLTRLVCIAPMVTRRCGSCSPHVARSSRRARRSDARRQCAPGASPRRRGAGGFGNATLETRLCKRPDGRGLQLGAVTAFLLQKLGLVKVRHFSQPNLLAGAELVPEFLPARPNAANLAGALARWLTHPEKSRTCRRVFRPACAPALQRRRARGA